MKLNVLIPALAIALGLSVLNPTSARAEDQAASPAADLDQVEADVQKAIEANDLSDETLMSLDAEMEEFRNRNPRQGGGNRGGHDMGRPNHGRPNHGRPTIDRGNRHNNDRWSTHRPPPPRPRPVPPRYPRPVPPRYPRYPVPVPVPVPQPQAWVCSAHPIYNTYQLYNGYRSYSYMQARESALQQCTYLTGTQCAIYTCNVSY